MDSLKNETIYDVDYTENERRIYEFIASQPNRLAMSTEVIRAIYDRRRPPVNARIIVGGMLNTLKRKMDRNRTRMILKKSPRRGPHPIKWQLVPRREVRPRGEARPPAA